MVHEDTEVLNSYVWLLDSGSSHHLTGRRELFKELHLQHAVKLGNDQDVTISGKMPTEVLFQVLKK